MRKLYSCVVVADPQPAVSPEQLNDTEAEAPAALASLYIVADLDSPEGRDLAKSALQLVVSCAKRRHPQ